jgi:hypothetical protein
MDKIALNEDVERNRRKAAQLAVQILDGSLDVLEAAIEMHKLRWWVDVDEDDPDFAAFTLVESEIDALPVGPQRQYWSEDALARKEPELQRSREWARSTVEHECRNIIARFGG